VAQLLAGYMSAYRTTTVNFNEISVNAESIRAWLTERADINERREQRMEAAEWAVLIFVAVGVVADILLVIHR
jgi:hypothetical protein